MAAQRLLVRLSESDEFVGTRKIEARLVMPQRLPFQVVHGDDDIAIALQRVAIAHIPAEGADLRGGAKRDRPHGGGTGPRHGAGHQASRRAAQHAAPRRRRFISVRFGFPYGQSGRFRVV